MSNTDETKQFDLKWKEIYTSGIQKVFLFAENKQNFKFPQNEYIKLYSEAYNLCTSKKATLYQTKCYNNIIDAMKEYCLRVRSKIKLSNKYEMLSIFSEMWASYKEIIIKWMLKFFLYLTKSFYFSKQNINLEYQLKLIFHELVYKECENDLKSIFFETLNNLRDNQIIETSNLKTFIEFIANISPNQGENLYDPEFELLILNSSVEYFKQVYTQAQVQNNISCYLTWGINIIKNEENRLRLFLPHCTVEKAIIYGKNVLFYNPHEQILESANGFKSLLQNYDILALKLCYEIYCNDKQSLNIIGQIFKVFLTEQFRQLIMNNQHVVDSEDPREIGQNTNFINEFILFFNNYNKILVECFQTNHQFNIIFKEVLESALVNNKFNTSYVLPFFLDKHMKRSNNHSSNDSLNIINQVLTIFTSVPEKDVFIEIHRNLLSKRLLSEDFNSLENEKMFIGKLKLMCGVTFTSHVEGMLSDFSNSRDLNDNYRNWARENANILEGSNNIEFHITLLTSSCWPTLNVNNLIIDKSIQNLIYNFTKFYNSSFPKRGLTFSYINSICEIERKFGGKPYCFHVNTLQALILLLFNHSEYGNEINLRTIIHKIGLNEEDLKICLIPLLHSRLLLKSPEELNVFSENDLLKVNSTFHNNNRKLRLITYGKYEEIVKKEKIEDDRSHAIEATIVREMKGSKKLHHNDLVNKVLTQLENFKIQISFIKKKIDNLIEREIIGRDPIDKDYYIYTYS